MAPSHNVVDALALLTLWHELPWHGSPQLYEGNQVRSQISCFSSFFSFLSRYFSSLVKVSVNKTPLAVDCRVDIRTTFRLNLSLFSLCTLECFLSRSFRCNFYQYYRGKVSEYFGVQSWRKEKFKRRDLHRFILKWSLLYSHRSLVYTVNFKDNFSFSLFLWYFI